MSGFMDKAKDAVDDLKEKAEGLKDKAVDAVDDLKAKFGDKVPDSVENKIEDMIPGDKDGDGH